VYLFSEARYCGYYDRFTAPAQDLDGTTVISDGVRSLSVAGPYSVTLYPDRDFAGLPALVLGDVPDLGGTTIGTRTASLRVEPFTPTLPLANDGRAFPFTLTLGLSPTGYLQDLSASTSVPEDPIPSCLESRGEHTLWYRPLLREPAVVTVHLAGPGDAVLALWQEGPAGLQELACARAGGAGLRLVLPAGVPLLLEAAGRDGPSGTLSLVVWREPAWSVYLPLVLRGHRT